MPYKDLEKRKEYKKEHYLKNKEKIKEKNKEYYLKNKEKHKEKTKEYAIKNKGKIKEYNQSPKGKKSNTISKWKQSGLIADNIDELYDRYINSTNCELCGNEYKNTKDRCLDHDHNTGLFRNVVCQSCNTSSKLKEIQKNNTSGYKNIQLTKNNTFKVKIIIKKKIYRKSFKTIEEAILYRDNLLSYSIKW